MCKISAVSKSLHEAGLFGCWQSESPNGRKTKISYNPTIDQWAQTYPNALVITRLQEFVAFDYEIS